MKNILLLYISVFLLTLNSYAQDKFPQYKVGEGAQYSMNVDGQPADVKMAFVKSTSSLIVVEMEMKMSGGELGIPINMIQQFHLKMDGGKIKIAKGIMKIPNLPKPQILPAEFLKGYDGAQVGSFLIDSKSDIDGMKVSESRIQTAEGTVKATQYRRESNGQTVDFWITDDEKLKPLSIVMMKSKGKKKEHNYTMQFKGLVKGYKSQVDASNAEPLNAMGRMFLPMLTNSNMFLN